MRKLPLVVFLLLIACGYKSGQHSSSVSVCNGKGAQNVHLDATGVDALEQGLRKRLTDSGFAECKPTGKHEMQLGATPKAWFCGKIGGASVEAAINRPGTRECVLELDLRTDVSGPVAEVRAVEEPIVNYRDATRTWLAEQLAAAHTNGTSLAMAGAWLGCDETCQHVPPP